MKILTGILAMLLFSGVAWAGNFTDNHNGIVVDKVTGLWWQQQDDGIARDWLTAITYCENLNIGNYWGWRLPNRNELESIADDNSFNPALASAIFPNTKTVGYWTSTTSTDLTSEAVVVNFYNGFINRYSKALGLYVRCVRDEPNITN